MPLATPSVATLMRYEDYQGASATPEATNDSALEQHSHATDSAGRHGSAGCLAPKPGGGAAAPTYYRPPTITSARDRLLRGQQHLDDSLPLVETAQRLSNDRPQHLAAVGAFHCVAWR